MSDSAPGSSRRFVWHDLMTPDVDTAVDFYCELLGWTVREVDRGQAGTYRMIVAGGADRGSFVPLEPGSSIAPHWIGYIGVRDVDAVAARVGEAGGDVPIPPADVPGVGRFAVIQDPAGAPVALISGVNPHREPAGTPPLGTFCWDELLTPDAEAVAGFYTTVFGWQHASEEMGEGWTYHLFKDGDDEVAGMIQMPSDAEGPPSWLPYLAVADADATARRVEELGGKIFVAPRTIPGVGRMTVTADPTGAMVAFLGPEPEPN